MASRRHRGLHASLWAASWLFPVVLAANQTCFQVGYGFAHPAGGWYPCNNTAAASDGTQICCQGGDTCSQDGLCRGINLSGDTTYYNAGCTDSTYTNPICRKSCLSFSTDYVQWLPSEQEWTCCGSTCPKVSNVTFQAVSPNDFPLLPSSVSSSTSTHSMTTSTSSSAATSFATGTPVSGPGGGQTGDTGLSTGAQAGIGVGVSVAGFAVIGAGIFYYLRRRRQARSPDAELAAEKRAVDEYPYKLSHGSPRPPPVYTATEVSGESAPVEIDGRTGPSELAGSSPRRT